MLDQSCSLNQDIEYSRRILVLNTGTDFRFTLLLVMIDIPCNSLWNQKYKQQRKPICSPLIVVWNAFLKNECKLRAYYARENEIGATNFKQHYNRRYTWPNIRLKQRKKKNGFRRKSKTVINFTAGIMNEKHLQRWAFK